MNILSVLWTDSCDVYEFTPFQKENGSTYYREEMVLSQVPCRISFKSSPPAGGFSGGESGLSQKIKLFLPVSYTIKPGSKISVCRDGDVTHYRHSGNAARYSAHQEIELSLLQENC